MQPNRSFRPRMPESLALGGIIALVGLTLGLGLGLIDRRHQLVSQPMPPSLPSNINFLVAAGGGRPSYNEIALEKNVLYFQRTLTNLGRAPESAQVYFANGNNGDKTIRYLDTDGQERFKAPDIPHLSGAATWLNLHQAFQSLSQRPSDCSTFFYFTGHGTYNNANPDNNAMILWQERMLSVQALVSWLDEMPPDRPFVTMMAQCYSGAFANLIYEQGDPAQPVALHTRCGFFATVADRPSVGCTAAVNEADYRDYSSSFFAGLSGRDRVGKTVTSADYDQNGIISYAEAHAFAKIDEATTDWPISTTENWLQQQATTIDQEVILGQAMTLLMAEAAPQRRFVVTALADKLELSLSQSYQDQRRPVESDTVEEAYWKRLEMELINIGMTERIRSSADVEQQIILDKLADCESGSWH